MVKTWQIVLATVAIFVAGLVTGGASAFGIVRWVAHRFHGNPAPMGAPGFRYDGRPQQFGPQLMRSFANQLDLTDEEKAKIEPIVKHTAIQLGRERREVQLTTALAIEKMQDEIADVLTPGQRSKFEELIAQQRARLQQLRKAEGPPPAWPAPPRPVDSPK